MDRFRAPGPADDPPTICDECNAGPGQCYPGCALDKQLDENDRIINEMFEEQQPFKEK